MIFADFFGSTLGGYICSVMAGLAIGVLLADSAFPAIRTIPTIATICGITGFVIYATSITAAAPLAGFVFLIVCMLSSTFYTAHRLRSDERFKVLRLGERLALALKTPRQLKELLRATQAQP